MPEEVTPTQKQIRRGIRSVWLGVGFGALVIGGIAVYSFVSLFIALFGPPEPTDDSLLANYRKHKDVFQEMAQRFDADNRRGVSYGWVTYPDAHAEKLKKAAPGLQERLRLLREAEIPMGFSDASGPVYCYVWLDGFAAFGGQDKGYIYCPKPPKPLVASLDSHTPAPKGDYQAYRPIEGNWYLFYTHSD